MGFHMNSSFDGMSESEPVAVRSEMEAIYTSLGILLSEEYALICRNEAQSQQIDNRLNAVGFLQTVYLN